MYDLEPRFEIHYSLYNMMKNKKKKKKNLEKKKFRGVQSTPTLILNMFGHFQWAHFPAIQYKGDGDYSQTGENVTMGPEVTEVIKEYND